MRHTLSILAGLLLGIAGNALAACPPLLDSRVKTLQGDTVDLCQYAGKPILVVNTASKCGYTPQFEALEALYQRYRAQGLLVIGFPSNDFKQELASNKEIGDFCRLTYLVKFPMAEASHVTGDDANALYRRLAAASGSVPKWNFHKYLIAPDGKTVTAFPSKVVPDDPAITGPIKGWLAPQ
ncbi:glutathione peroxidase [Chitiniphilus shinanonensis]|uniref:Glutathione peroxidase n=1 Tax=Chitiniphilus shinanonensis TaxID=553088 RepID=A0ABQ6BUI5_9NEIS|nr:glutathione peroxidase [Chitiniphilus shinanonensis]GLS04996.1 glutathione peroxidase [Chitiniphilus shinanonensis]